MNTIAELLETVATEGARFIPLWQLTRWNTRFVGVDKRKQPETIDVPRVGAAKMRQMERPGGKVRLLYSGERVAWTTEEIAGKYLRDGEVLTVPDGGALKNIKHYRGKFVNGNNSVAMLADGAEMPLKFIWLYMQEHAAELERARYGLGVGTVNMMQILEFKVFAHPPPCKRGCGCCGTVGGRIWED